MSHQPDGATPTPSGGYWKRTSGLTIGALGAIGVAVVAGPLRRRLRDTLPFLCLHGRGTPGADVDAVTEESEELQALLTAARSAGCTDAGIYAAVSTILTLFIEHLPTAQRSRLLIQLPSDVRLMAISPRRSDIAISLLPNTIDALVDAVSQVTAVPRDTSHEVVVAVLQTLHAVLPEECRDIQADLPLELADLWTVSPVPVEAGPGAD